ncbi:hypothetical protein Z949_283 [Sulfitobacter guttiformis KCTC 32187]|uniref:Uncharacterized protein n=1 Tax=Sulfitobacter guttiformis TaxID=74349 RepID=A0A420DTV3_9RHOB|nr:hypothetical protein [Sulfitobacter guttiformis]KIN71127.1 hypothetical protein Z949_283 [Sulfitobacter guttiformis KCTC 32187]RKE97608.1 hypothetical protein C8N30_2220 [Sulfitobacter guttiformis]
MAAANSRASFLYALNNAGSLNHDLTRSEVTEVLSALVSGVWMMPNGAASHSLVIEIYGDWGEFRVWRTLKRQTPPG